MEARVWSQDGRQQAPSPRSPGSAVKPLRLRLGRGPLGTRHCHWQQSERPHVTQGHVCPCVIVHDLCMDPRICRTTAIAHRRVGCRASRIQACRC
eukprot:6202531-Pleurochrysis_carterae.AAC.1